MSLGFKCSEVFVQDLKFDISLRMHREGDRNNGTHLFLF